MKNPNQRAILEDKIQNLKNDFGIKSGSFEAFKTKLAGTKLMAE